MRSFHECGLNGSLMIADKVVTVLEIQPTWVRLGIDDPTAFPSYREATLHLEDDDGGREPDAECYESTAALLSAW